MGTQLAEQMGTGSVVAVLMGTITGAAGGVARDVLSAEVPVLFRKNEPLYATAAILGCSLYLWLVAANLGQGTASVLAIGAIATLRLLAIFFNIGLPAFTIAEADSKR